MRRASFALCAALLVALAQPARADVADYIGKTIASVRLEIETREVTDSDLQQIVATRTGAPLSMLDVRETVSRLFSLGRFEDVRVHADLSPAGVRLVYDLVPVHPVDRIEFTGATGGPGVDTGRLRRELVERFGVSPPVGRAPDLVRVVEDDLHAEGYLHPVVTPRAELRHAPDRATLVFQIDAGERTRIGGIDVTGTPGLSREELLKLLDVAPGAPYRTDALANRIARYVDNRRSRGYFEAKIVTSTRFDEGQRTVQLTLNATEGPRVRVVFAGDALPADRRADLVPIEREGSADEDLLEDSSNRIEDYLRAQGYRDASAPHTREEKDGELLITFTVKKGPEYRVARVELSGNTSFATADLSTGLRVRVGQPFAASRLDADVAAIEDFYRRQGFASVRVQPDEEAAPRDQTAAGTATADVPVTVRIDIQENVRTVVSSLHVRGGGDVPEAELVAPLGLQPGRPLFLTQLALDRDAIQQHYANLGFQTANVTSNPGLSADRARADVVFTVDEGPRLFVEHVLIVGNVRTKTETIEREVQFKQGDPLGLNAVNETQRRLAALGLFRRVEITAIGHGETSRDVLIRVDEAPVTTIGYGGGVEANQQAVQDAEGLAQTRIVFAPRAFFEIGRRNLFGKNRSVNLFTRFSLPFNPDTGPISEGGTFGFTEYRILGTFREPHVFGTQADAFITGTLEQQHRTGFDFARRAVNVEAGRRLTGALSVSANYQLQNVRLFNVIPSDDQPLVDRAFPQVRLSSFSLSAIRSTRNDPVDPTAGTYASVNAQMAARAIGSEVGFLKSYARAQWFHTLPHAHGTVLATNATLGLADALPRNVPQADGTVLVSRDIPASERFFAGGDTTVRGFGLDQLGRPDTIDQTNGFAIGGNGLVVLNAELRAPYHNFQFVTFFDTGNVFARPSEISLTDLRSSLGIGIRYKSPVGPIRVDLGFKVHRQDVASDAPGVHVRESLTAIHISLGQAF
jgi:outer membrane protein insertion porin family